jgi:serine/threonine protein phosphatase PrpC
MVAGPEDRFCEACGAPIDGVSQPADPPTRPVERRKNCRCLPADAQPDEAGFCRSCGFRVAVQPDDEPNLELPIDADLAALSDRGRRYRRTGMNNQDAALAARLPDGGALLAVADGVGSANNAEAASAAAVAAIRKVLEAIRPGESPKKAMIRAIKAAQAAVLAVPVPRPDPAKAPPESTIAAALVRDGRATIGWVGDSRVYLVAGRSGRVLTRDDSWLIEVVESGAMTIEAARADRRCHTITQCLGVVDMDIDIHVEDVPVKAGSWLVLCTDGLWNYLEDGDRMAGAMAEGPEDADALMLCRRLTLIANESGGHDNISVAMVRIVGALAKRASRPHRNRGAAARLG